jgi:hypothetical protein
VQDGTPTAFSSTIYDSNKGFFIGSFDGTPASFYDGLVDEVIVWDTDLTDGEMLIVKNITNKNQYHVGGSFIHNMI